MLVVTPIHNIHYMRSYRCPVLGTDSCNLIIGATTEIISGWYEIIMPPLGLNTQYSILVVSNEVWTTLILNSLWKQINIFKSSSFICLGSFLTWLLHYEASLKFISGFFLRKLWDNWLVKFKLQNYKIIMAKSRYLYQTFLLKTAKFN